MEHSQIVMLLLHPLPKISLPLVTSPLVKYLLLSWLACTQSVCCWKEQPMTMHCGNHTHILVFFYAQILLNEVYCTLILFRCEDHKENEALDNSIVIGILSLFSMLGAGGEDYSEPSPQKSTASLVIVKTACFALAISMKASISFATDFYVIYYPSTILV
jgi:hypothetical protein